MGVRDRELKRLTQYANSMGVKVLIKEGSNSNRSRAEWNMSGEEITLYVSIKDSKLSIILSFIHELGHHLSFIHDDKRRHPPLLVTALERDLDGLPLSKAHRYAILKTELMGMRWWECIYLETKMSFPIYKLYLEREYDTWYYNYMFQVGRDPSRKERKAKLKQLKDVFNAKTAR